MGEPKADCVVCMRIDEMRPWHVITEGSTVEECDNCGTEVLLSPASSHLMKETNPRPNLLCRLCYQSQEDFGELENLISEKELKDFDSFGKN